MKASDIKVRVEMDLDTALQVIASQERRFQELERLVKEWRAVVHKEETWLRNAGAAQWHEGKAQGLILGYKAAPTTSKPFYAGAAEEDGK